jgi:hypothetical protein
MFKPFSTVVVAFASLALVSACGDDGGGGGGGGGNDAAPQPDAAPQADAAPQPDAAPNATGPVTDLSSQYTGPCDQVDLSWTNPTDATYAGVLVLRFVGGAVPDVPENGTGYTADEVLAGGSVVAFVGDATSFQDTTGFNHTDNVHYAVYTFTAGNTYSTAVATDITVDQSLGAQTGKLSVNLGNNQVTVTSPLNFPTTGTANFDAGTNTLTIDVGITNDACRAVHNIKLTADTLNEGTAVAAGDITFAGKEALHFGVGALADQATSANHTFTFTNVSGATDPFEVDFSIIDSPSLVVSGNYDDANLVIDSSGAVDSVQVDLTPLEFGGGDSTCLGGAISPDGELYYCGHGQQPEIVTVDLATLTAVGNTDLTGADNIQTDTTGSIGYVASVTESPDGSFLYAVLITNDHRGYFCGDPNGGGNCDIAARIDPANPSSDVELVRVDRETMVEVDRLTLLTASTVRPRASTMSMSADGKKGAIAMRREGTVFLVDLDNMTLIDGDANTAGEQPFDVSTTSTEAHHVALSADGSQFAVAYRGNGRGGPDHDETLDLVDVATGTITQQSVSPSSATTDNQSGALAFGPDGRLYYARKSGLVGLSVFDLATPAETELLGDTAVDALFFAPDGASYYSWDSGGVLTHFSIADDTIITVEADGANDAQFSDGFGHVGLSTPL